MSNGCALKLLNDLVSKFILQARSLPPLLTIKCFTCLGFFCPNCNPVQSNRTSVTCGWFFRFGRKHDLGTKLAICYGHFLPRTSPLREVASCVSSSKFNLLHRFCSRCLIHSLWGMNIATPDVTLRHDWLLDFSVI